MAEINNNVSLMLRALQLNLHHDKYSVGKVYQDAASLYNSHRGSGYPYEMNYHDNASNLLTVALDSDSSPNTRYVYNFDNVDIFEGVDFTHNDYYSVLSREFYSDNLNNVDLSMSTEAENIGYGTFLIGPEGPYHNYVINDSSQSAYWSHIKPSGLFNTAYMDMESTGVYSFTSNGHTHPVPRLYDIHRDSYHYPNGLTSLGAGYAHNVPDFVNEEIVYTTQSTRALASSGTDLSITGSTAGLCGILEPSYNLGALTHTDNDDNFSLYIKFKATGYVEEISKSLKTNSICLFKNHTIKVALVPVTPTPNIEGGIPGQYRIAVMGRVGNDTTNTFSVPDNANRIVGFDPDPAARNAIRTNVSGQDPNDIYYQWLGSDSDLVDSLTQNNTITYNFPYKFGINKLAFYDNNEDRDGYDTLNVLGRVETPGDYGDITEYNKVEEDTNIDVWPYNNSAGGDVTYIDQELEYWYNWSILFPKPIGINRSTSLVLSYASSGCDERNDQLFRNFRDPYNSGVIMENVPTLSITWNNSEANASADAQMRIMLDKYRGFFNNDETVDDNFHSAHQTKNKSNMSSYDINFMYNTNVQTGQQVKPFQTIGDASSNKAYSENVFNGFTGQDFYSSGYLGTATFDGIIEEFGYGTNTINPEQRKALVENVANLGGLVGYNTDNTFTAVNDKISLVVSSGTSYGENSIGGIFENDYSISSYMDIPITNYLCTSADPTDGVFIWNMDPFLDPDDLVVNVVLAHTDYDASSVTPTVYCDIIDKSTEQQDMVQDPGVGLVPADTPYKQRADESASLNQKGTWYGERYTLDATTDIKKFVFSGVLDDGSCGNWDLRDKIVRFNVEYPSSGTAYDAQLDIYAMDLDIDWFKASVEVTGNTSDPEHNVDLFIKGVTSTPISKNMDLFIQSDKVDNYVELFIGVDNGMPSGLVDLFMAGSESGVSTIYNNHTLYMRGLTSASGDTPLFLQSKWPNGALPLYVGSNTPDSVVTVDQTNLTINGQYSSDTDKTANLFIYGVGSLGDVDPESVLPLYIQGPPSDDSFDPNNAMNLFMEGMVYRSNDNVSLSLINNKTESTKGMDLVIRRSGTDGALPSTGNIPLYIERIPAYEGMVGLYMTGHDSPITSGVDMFITGKLPTETLDTNMFMANYNQTDNLEIYMRGF